MICEACQYAGDANALGYAEKADEYHDECEGDCGCRHKVGRGWVARPKGKQPVNRVQSP